MSDNTNPTSNGTIDLRNQQGASGVTGTGAATNPADDKFDIPETIKKLYPDIIQLILQTESMTDDERQYWFQIMPIMSEDQIKKLREILANEKQQLEQIDKQYTKEVKRINDKHAVEWKAMKEKEKRQKLRTQEGAAETKEKQEEEELLKKLQGL